ncbi:unnamed protein product [Caenorhabditis bovis]|uniref:non-specific serine/threonine protein kinase n=1 Tax=Caenorhabditis bovis TaxID=2654633 RepID=A0A8S1F2A0_9PELO|nr:unnamed protein product [Caenorhabditis bovis]
MSRLTPSRSPRMRRFADQLAQIRISLDPPSPPFLSPSPLGDIHQLPPMNYLQVPGETNAETSAAFPFPSRALASPPPDRRTSFASTMSDTNSSVTIPMSVSYQNLLSPMWSTVKYCSDDNETPPNEPVPRRSKSALCNRSSSDCINVPPIVFSPVLSRPVRSISPTMSSPTFRTHHGSDSESDTDVVWRGSGSALMIPRRSFNYHHSSATGHQHHDLDSAANVERLLKRNRRKTMAIHGAEVSMDHGISVGGNWSSSSMTNLCRVRSTLGHSDPQLSSSSSAHASTTSLHPKPSPSNLRSARPSLHASTSPVTLQRCRSPLRIPQRSTSSSQNFAVVAGPSSSVAPHATVPIQLRQYSARNGSSLMAPVQDTRRWSLASLPSTSGYGTPGTGSNSGVSSQYSSTEHIGEMIDNMRVGPVRQASSRYDSNESYDDVTTPQPSNSFLNRPRSRSLTSPAKFVNEFNLEIVNRTSVYKEKFPKAKLQMEERLSAFVAENGPLSGGITLPNIDNEQEGDELVMRSRRSTVLDAESYADRNLLRLIGDGATRFLHHQIVEIAADCLAKSRDDLITCSYFCEMSQRLEETLNEAQMKTSPESLDYLSKLVKRLLMIVSRPARLLECLEFDPDEFYQLLEEAEGVVREQLGSGTARVPDLPQYIIGKLGLDRDPMLDSTEQVDEVPTNPPSVPSTNKTEASFPDTNRPPCEDDFETIRLVSNGAYGAVHLVRHKETRQRYALKKMNKHTLMLRNQVDQVFAERDILTMADNPFVVSFYGSFETRHHLCMLMEYVEGGDCAALLKSAGTLPLELARLYIAETVLAIEYLHSYGIVHRDLKPDNLLITAMGHIKLTDFGLSKIGLMNRTTLVAEGCGTVAETQQFQDKQLCGTPEYIAPEVILRRGYGKPVDWWALGIILYEFLVGIVPFFGETPEILFSKVINEEVEYPTEDEALPVEAEDLIRKLLEKNPAERLGTISGATQLVAHPFFASLDFNTLLRQKAEFVPQLDNEEDTSYFDTRQDRYNHEAESCEDDSTSCMMFNSFSTASPRHSIVSIDPSLMPHIISSASPSISSPIERSNSMSSGKSETRPERSYSTGQAPDSLADDTISSAENLRRRFSAQRQHVSTTSSSGTGSGNAFATAASSTDSSIDASTLPLFHSGRRSDGGSRSPLPRFAISYEGTTSEHVDEHDEKTKNESNEPVKFRNQALQLVIPGQSSSSSSTSTAATAASSNDSKETCYVMYSNPVTVTSQQLSPGGVSVSSASSADVGASPQCAQTSDSPSTDVPLSKNIAIKKGPFGYGFTLKSVRVYLGEHSEYYTIEHIVTCVIENSPACLAGLRADDMITHVNGHPVHNLTHPQLMHRLLSGGNEIQLKVTPLSSTSIREGAARRNVGKMAKKKPKRPQRRVPLEKKARKPSALLRRLSGKRSTNDIVPGSSSQKQAFMPRSASSQDGSILTHLPGTTTTRVEPDVAATSAVDLEPNRPSSIRGNSSPSSPSMLLNPTASAITRKPKYTEGVPSEHSGIAIVKQKSQSIAVSPLARDSRIRSPSPSRNRPQSTISYPSKLSTSTSSVTPVAPARRSSYQPTSSGVAAAAAAAATPTPPPTSTPIPQPRRSLTNQSRGFSAAAAQSAQNLLSRILPKQQDNSGK